MYNDHLPLKSIFTKSTVKSPPRIQGFLLRLQKFNFGIHYMQGSLLTVADTLSRATLTDYQTEVNENELNCFVHSTISNYLISDSRLQQFQDETQKDETLWTVIKFIQYGWPSEPSKLPPNVCLYFTYHEDLCYINGLVLKENRVNIPKTLQNEIVKIKNRAREILFWPGMNSEIENIVRNFDVYQQYHNRQGRETFIYHEIPD